MEESTVEQEHPPTPQQMYEHLASCIEELIKLGGGKAPKRPKYITTVKDPARDSAIDLLRQIRDSNPDLWQAIKTGDLDKA